jgi:hypothetical protein
VLEIPEAAFREIERANLINTDKAIFDQFSESEQNQLLKFFSPGADLYKFQYQDSVMVLPPDLKGKTLTEGEKGRKFWI